MTAKGTKAPKRKMQPKQRKQRKATAADLMEIARHSAARLKQPPEDHGTLLYDEHGLPK